MDENQIKIMIIKLMQIEKLMKEVGHRKKQRAKALNRATKVGGGRRSSNVSSTAQNFQRNRGIGRPDSKNRIATIEEDANSDNSD